MQVVQPELQHMPVLAVVEVLRLSLAMLQDLMVVQAELAGQLVQTAGLVMRLLLLQLPPQVRVDLAVVAVVAER